MFTAFEAVAVGETVIYGWAGGCVADVAACAASGGHCEILMRVCETVESFRERCCRLISLMRV